MNLADTSAWVISRRIGGEVRASFDATVVSGEVATCPMVVMELLYNTQTQDEFRTRSAQLAHLPECPIESAQWQRALEVYGLLAEQGGLHHRAVRHADLMIAAAAEAADREVLHYDADYDRIAAITGQATKWLVPKGSI